MPSVGLSGPSAAVVRCRSGDGICQSSQFFARDAPQPFRQCSVSLMPLQRTNFAYARSGSYFEGVTAGVIMTKASIERQGTIADSNDQRTEVWMMLQMESAARSKNAVAQISLA